MAGMAELGVTAALTDVDAMVNYAGDIVGRGRFDLVEPERTNLILNPTKVRVHDVRARASMPSLAEAGFEYIKHRSAVAEKSEFFESNLVHQSEATDLNFAYEAELSELLKEKLGAREVFAQIGGLIVRTSDRAKRKSWAGAAGFVHLDFTSISAQGFLKWTTAARGIEPKPWSRMVMMQTWRALSSGPQDNTLAICNGATIPPDDAVLFDSCIGDEDTPGMFFESRLCKYRSTHEWFYLSNMEPDDLLLFKGYDSDVPLAMNAMHTAFDNPIGENGPARRSVEARFFLLFD